MTIKIAVELFDITNKVQPLNRKKDIRKGFTPLYDREVPLRHLFA